jgi:hypothetical protein
MLLSKERISGSRSVPAIRASPAARFPEDGFSAFRTATAPIALSSAG